jgi:hypothetical protein
MSLKVMLANLTALVVVLGGVSVVQAQHCGAVAAPACGADPCCYPKVRYKTCYQTVVEERCKTVWQTVHKTIEKECRYTVCRPVWETVEQDCKKIVCKPVWEEKQVKVCCGEWREEKYYCPGPVKAIKHRTPDTCCFDPCTCKTVRIPGQCCTEYVQCPGTWKCKKVWVPREEIRTVKCCRMVQEEVCEKVQVKVCRMVKEEVCKKVPVTVCEKVPVQVVEKVCKKVPVKVAVCECEQPRCFKLSLGHGCNSCGGGCGHSFSLGCHLSSLKDRIGGLCGRLCSRNQCCDAAPAYGAHYAPAAAPAPMPVGEKIAAPKEAAPAPAGK